MSHAADEFKLWSSILSQHFGKHHQPWKDLLADSVAAAQNTPTAGNPAKMQLTKYIQELQGGLQVSDALEGILASPSTRPLHLLQI